jgi:hypothetical protein
MNEKIDWEQKLKAAGMPEELPFVEEELKGFSREVAQQSAKPSFEKEISDMPDPLMRRALEKFSTLPEDMQRIIIDDIKANRDTDMPLEEVKLRIYNMVEGTHKMVKIPPFGTDELLEGEPDGRAKTIDELIEKMERMSYEREAEKKDGLVN